MFKSKKTVNPGRMDSSFDSFFGEDIVIDGNVTTKGNLRLDGLIKGNVSAKGSLIIGNQGKVEGNIEGGEVEVFGKIEGNVRANENLIIRSTGNVQGDVEVQLLTIDEGGHFEGYSKMLNNKTLEIASKEMPKLP